MFEPRIVRVIKIFSITLMLVVCWATPAWASSVEKGRSAYFAGDFERAFKVWEPLAKI